MQVNNYSKYFGNVSQCSHSNFIPWSSWSRRSWEPDCRQGSAAGTLASAVRRWGLDSLCLSRAVVWTVLIVWDWSQTCCCATDERRKLWMRGCVCVCEVQEIIYQTESVQHHDAVSPRSWSLILSHFNIIWFYIEHRLTSDGNAPSLTGLWVCLIADVPGLLFQGNKPIKLDAGSAAHESPL